MFEMDTGLHTAGTAGSEVSLAAVVTFIEVP
jgi:hypothetical protein